MGLVGLGYDAELERLMKKDIKIGDTAYGRLLARDKKELTAALSRSTKKERDEYRASMNFMDTVEAGKDGREGAA